MRAEADIQVLASIRRTEVEGQPSDRATIESHADKYWKYIEDWSGSWTRLVDEGFIKGDDSAYELTTSGRPLAEKYFAGHHLLGCRHRQGVGVHCSID